MSELWTDYSEFLENNEKLERLDRQLKLNAINESYDKSDCDASNTSSEYSKYDSEDDNLKQTNECIIPDNKIHNRDTKDNEVNSYVVNRGTKYDRF